MTWQNAINIKLNLEDISRQIISDYTGLLLSAEFLLFLQTKTIKFKIASDLSELNSFSSDSSVNIILTDIINVPEYLSSKADIKTFALSDLPLNIEVKAIEQLKTSQLLSLLNYLNSTSLLQSIDRSNIQQHLQQAGKNQLQSAIDEYFHEMDLLLQTEIHYDIILQLGMLLGKLQYSIYLSGNLDYQKKLQTIQQSIDEYSLSYVTSGNLKEIFYESASNIKSVDRIIHYLKTFLPQKIALVCFDCMGISEWQLLKEYLGFDDSTCIEKQTFSLIPSITSISRSAIFYGTHTDVFQLSSINESKALQEQFPDKHCKLFKGKDLMNPDTLLGYDVVSVIYNFFDDIAHSVEFPPQYNSKSLYFDAARNYLANSGIAAQITTLLNEGYRIFFCSDHGSIIATGNGKKIEKYLQDKFAKRACIIQETSADEFSEFQKIQIPFVSGKLLVLPNGRTMFDQLNKTGITHGGITVEEIVVPFIEIRK